MLNNSPSKKPLSPPSSSLYLGHNRNPRVINTHPPRLSAKDFWFVLKKTLNLKKKILFYIVVPATILVFFLTSRYCLSRVAPTKLSYFIFSQESLFSSICWANMNVWIKNLFFSYMFYFFFSATEIEWMNNRWTFQGKKYKTQKHMKNWKK